jgi:hypothetical protein
MFSSKAPHARFETAVEGEALAMLLTLAAGVTLGPQYAELKVLRAFYKIEKKEEKKIKKNEGINKVRNVGDKLEREKKKIKMKANLGCNGSLGPA